MTSSLRIEEVLPAITGGLVADFDMALARIWLLMPDRHCPLCVSRGRSGDEPALHLVASDGLHQALDGRYHRVEVGALKIGAIAAGREPLVSEALLGDPRIPDQDWVRAHGLRGFAGHPLLFQGELLGVLGAFAARDLGDAELEWLGIFARQAAIAIQNARLFASAERANLVLQAQNEALRRDAGEPPDAAALIGESAPMRALRRQIARAAGAAAPVLITGETGSGRAHAAGALHAAGPRAAGPLLRVSCAATSAAELFGEEHGGSARLRLGAAELAEGGTLLLEEIAELPLELQDRLVGLIERGEVRRMGGTRARSVDVRVVATTRHDLEARIRSGSFREELYYSLGVVVLDVPPLRRRAEDVPALALDFLRQAAHRLRAPAVILDDLSLDRLARYPWPGNVRELRNVIERAVILSDAAVVEVPESLLTPDQPSSLAEVEREHIRAVLSRTGGRIEGPRGAAVILGLHPNTLRSRMERLGLGRNPRNIVAAGRDIAASES